LRMMLSHSCNDPELFQKVKGAVSMHQVVEHYGIQVNKKGLCLCPFHNDNKPSLKIYPNGRGFYCFSCGTGGDLIKFVSLYREISNCEAAKELASAFGIPLMEPVTYREKREAELARNHRRAVAGFKKRALLYLKMYRILLCEAIHERNVHFYEALQNLTYIEYLIDMTELCPEDVYGDAKAVRRIGEIEGRITDWYIRIEADGTISR